MSDDPIDPAHVEAVMSVLEQTSVSDDAHALLTSTDPAVHAALLAALVRAGVLEEERWRVKCTCGKTLEGPATEVEAWAREHDDSPLTKHLVVWSPPAPRPWKRRYVTRWEETCD